MRKIPQALLAQKKSPACSIPAAPFSRRFSFCRVRNVGTELVLAHRSRRDVVDEVPAGRIGDFFLGRVMLADLAHRVLLWELC